MIINPITKNNKPKNAKTIVSFNGAFNFPIRKLKPKNAIPMITKIIPVLNL
jgi:hypothetical protein